MSNIPNTNPFAGVNPILMSVLQTAGTGANKSLFPAFHAAHITHLTDFLNDQLPPGYRAMGVQSIQVQRNQAVGDAIAWQNPIPDVAVYRTQPATAETATTSESLPIPVLELPLEVTLPPAKQLFGVGIFRVGSHDEAGDPIIRLELLSPSNKMPSVDARAYQENRRLCFESGTDLIEIDYLHETPSPILGVPHYPDDADAQPYSIALSRPSEDKLRLYTVGIDAPLPSIPIHLSDTALLAFDLDPVYQHTFIKGRWGELPTLIGRDLPPRLTTYRETDQTIIRAKLADLRSAAT